MTARVFGLGHPDRGDDAVGLLVADDVRRRAPLGVEVRRLEGSPLELLTSWDDADDVIVVDAVRAPTAPGLVRRFDVLAGQLPVMGSTGGTHDASLIDAIELARALGRLPAGLVVYGVYGASFGVGDAMTPAVRDAAQALGERIAGEVVPRRG
ncbi:MAG TPA: hydrogenase maturation protease [Euzebyales bacterium]|nr:hydrogenase maturation protease [Euzebyales bacterium]